jgi:glycosyltransferase involved in cell wall biosynthesis
MPDSKTSLRFFAPLDVQSGLGTGARAIFRALQQAPVALTLSNYNIGHEAHPRAPFSAREQMLPIDQTKAVDVTIGFQNADGFDAFLRNTGPAFIGAARKRVAHWVWELSEFPQCWARYAPPLDEIWAPTRFVRDAVAGTYACPVHVVPYPVSVTAPAPTRFRERFGIAPDEFVMCTMFDASSFVERKNPLPLFKALKTLRGRGVPARLVVKVTHPHLLADYFKSKGFDASDIEGLSIFSESLDHAGVLGLIDESNCLVSTHRSEGFGLTVAEALMLGKPVVATDYAGTRDFLTEATGFPVPHGMVAIESDLGPYRAGCLWADIDQGALVDRLLEVAGNPAAALARGARGRQLILDNLSPAAIAATLVSRGLV